MESVKCDVCLTVFDDCFSVETNQAYGCASDFYTKENQTYILSNYGSSFDTSRFLVTRQSPLHQQQGTICDHCIEQMINKEEATEDQNFDFWAPVKALQEQQRNSGLYKNLVITDSIFPEEIGKTYDELEILNEQRNKHKMD